MQHNDAVSILPTTIETQRFVPRKPASSSTTLTVGWIGSPSTAAYLEPLIPVLARLCARYPIEIKIVGAGPQWEARGLPVLNQPWQMENEVEAFQSLDIGVYPLPDDSWAAGKAGFKSIQYMSVGIPVVASPVGVNCEIIQNGDNGFLPQAHQSGKLL